MAVEEVGRRERPQPRPLGTGQSTTTLTTGSTNQVLLPRNRLATTRLRVTPPRATRPRAERPSAVQEWMVALRNRVPGNRRVRQAGSALSNA